MSAKKPEEVHGLFSTAFNAGNLNALMALYEADTTLIPQPGKVTRGKDAIRQALQQFLTLKGTMQLQSLYVINGPGVPLMSSQCKLTGSGPESNIFSHQVSVCDSHCLSELLLSPAVEPVTHTGFPLASVS